MRIKIIGDNDCARATRQLLRQAGFAVTEFLPADAVLHAPHAGYVLTIEIASSSAPDTGASADKPAAMFAKDKSFARGGHDLPGTGLPPATPPDATSTTHRSSPASEPGMALPPVEASAGSSAGGSAEAGPLPASSSSTGFSLCGVGVAKVGGTQAEACATSPILVDSVDCALEAAVLRHITQLSAAPVVLDRPGGVVHSERELRIVIPRVLAASGDSHADEAAAMAVEFGVLRGLLDLTSPPPKSIAMPARASKRKWWNFFAILLSVLFVFAGRVQAGPRPKLNNVCESSQSSASAAKAAFILQPVTARLKPCPTRPAGRTHADQGHRLKPVLLLPLRAVSARGQAVRGYGFLRVLSASRTAGRRAVVRVVEVRGEDGAFLHLAAALAGPAQAQFGTSQINLALIGGAAVSGSLYDSGNTALKVNCVVGCGAAAGFSDNGAFTAGSTSVNNISAVFNDSITALSSGNAGALRATSDRMLYVNIGKLGGTSLSGANVVDSGNTAFRVNCVVGCAAGFTDNSGFTAGTTIENNIGGVFNDGLASLSSGNAAAARITASRALHVNLRNASGTEIGTSSNPVRIDPVGTTTQPVSGTVTANQGGSNWSVNLAQVGGNAVVTGGVNGSEGVGGLAADGSATAGNPLLVAGKGSGNARVPIVCDNWTPISFSSTSAQKIITKASAKNIYICSINLVVAAATNVALLAGTQTTNQCDTSTAGLSGGTTTATGWNLAANGGLAYGNGMGVIMATASTGLDVCLLASAANQVSGAVSWTQF
jgi:hypothetical protein